MKTGTCLICEKESDGLWLLNLSQIDSLTTIEGINIRQDVCKVCATQINQAVKSLGNGSPTSMERAFGKAGVKNNSEAKSSFSNPRADIQNIQNDFLSALIKKKQLVQLEAVEGIGWRAYIRSFDNFSLVIKNEQDETEELIFKHAVKSIKPL